MKKTELTPQSKTTDELWQRINELESICYQLKNLIGSVPGDVYWKNTDGVWIGLNKRCAQSLQRMGFIKDGVETEVIGKTDYQIFNKTTADGYKKNDMEVIINKTEITIEEKTHLQDGEAITLLSTKKPLFDENGQVVGIMGNTIDITYLKKIESELLEAKNAADASSRAKDEFIRNMSHDIRTPLSGIIGMSSILENEVMSLEEKDHAHMINTSGEQLLKLLNSVLDIVATGKQAENHLDLTTFNIKELIRDIVDLERPSILLKNIELRVTLSDNLPEIIESDKVKIHRILLNILGNAVKFTENGLIEVGARLTDRENEAAQIEFYIRDTGIGIPEEEHENIFNRFFRGSSSYQGVYEGHGVGLHIVKRYVELLGGEIHLESQAGAGTGFTISIPAKIINSSPARPSQPEHQPDTSSCKGLRVLIIEDNVVALKTAENLLQHMGIEFKAATTGTSAVEQFKANEFHLVLSDIGLPDISGMEVTRQIRGVEQESGRMPIPVIGLSAHSQPQTLQEALNAGMNEVLSKPIRTGQIADLVNKYKLNISVQPIAETKAPEDNSGLPADHQQLFELEQYPLLDIEDGKRVLGSEQDLAEMLQCLIQESLPDDCARMKEAHAKNDWDKTQQLAHKIKGGAVYVGTIRLKMACQYLEKSQKSGQHEFLQPLYDQALRVIEETSDYVIEWLEKRRTYSA